MVINYDNNPSQSYQAPNFSSASLHSPDGQSQSIQSSTHAPAQITDSDREQRYRQSIENLIKCKVIKGEDVTHDFLNSILSCGDQDRIDALYSTIFSIQEVVHSQLIENGKSKIERKLVRKGDLGNIVTQFSFIISKDLGGIWNLVIVTDFIAKGSFKKFNRCIDLTAGEYRSRGIVTDFKFKNAKLAYEQIQNFISEVGMNNYLRRINPDIYNHHIHIINTYKGKAGQDKLVFLDKVIVGNARKLKNSSPKQVLTAAICMCRGLSQMNAAGYVHGDIKLENLFIETVEDLKEGIVKLGDLGGVKSTGQLMSAATYIAPEWKTYYDENGVLNDENGVFHISKIRANPKYDSFCAGMVILILIFSFSSQSYEHFDFIKKNILVMNNVEMKDYIKKIVKEIQSSVTDELGGKIFDSMANVAICLIRKNPKFRLPWSEACLILQKAQENFSKKIDVESPPIQDSFSNEDI